MYDINDININVLSYNRGDFIIETINSIINQSLKINEINVFDNFSNDNTIAVLNSITDKRINVFYNNKNIGALGNFKRAISNSKKKFTVIFHDDDIIHPDYMKFVLSGLNESSNVSLVCSGMTRTKTPQNLKFKNYKYSPIKFESKADFIRIIYLGFPLCFPSCVYKTENLKVAIDGKEKYGKIADRPIIYDSVNEGEEVVLLPGQFINYRVHFGQDSNTSMSGPFLNEVFELHKNYFEKLYLNSNLKNKLFFLVSFYHYMSLDFHSFKSSFKSKKHFILKLIRYIGGDSKLLFLSRFFYFLNFRAIYQAYRLLKRNFNQYS